MPAEPADTLNEIVALNQEMAPEFERVGLAVGKEGRIGPDGGTRRTACSSSSRSRS